MLKLGIAGKIWVSMSILGLGFLVSLVSGWSSKQFMEYRISMIRDLHLPRILAGQTAIETYKRMDQLYTNAVLFGEPEILEVAGNRNSEVRKSLSDVARTVPRQHPLYKRCTSLNQDLKSFHTIALPLYTDLAWFPDKERNPAPLKQLQETGREIETELEDIRKQCRLLFEDDLNKVILRMAKQQQWTLAAFMVFSLMTAFSTFYILNRQIVRPIKATVRAARNIAAGEYTSRLKCENQDEIGDLASSFNLMTTHLQSTLSGLEKEITERIKAERETHQLNIKLESRVVERTKDLLDANEELKHSMETLQATQNKLLEVEKMASLGSLVAGVAHEINTPVGVSVTMATHLSTESKLLTDKIIDGKLTKTDLIKFVELSREGTDILQINLEHAATLVKSFKQVAVDQESEEIREFDLREYVTEVMSSLALQLKKTAHSYHISCSDDLIIITYPGALAQIISNLVNNAILHGFSESNPGTISLDFSMRGRNVLFCFADNGRGIDEACLKKIFDPFYTTKRGDGGSGLGLHIVYNLVTQKLKGAISCKSIYGEGTTFELVFPANVETGNAYDSFSTITH